MPRSSSAIPMSASRDASGSSAVVDRTSANGRIAARRTSVRSSSLLEKWRYNADGPTATARATSPRVTCS